MRAAYVCTDPGVPVFGSKGASVHVQAILRELLRRGAQVDLICARTGGQAPADLEAVHVHLLPPVGKGPAPERERAAQLSDAAVGRMLDGLGQPVDLVYERYALWGRTGPAWAARNGVPALLEVNAPLVQEHARHRGLHDGLAAESVAEQALSTAQAVVCVSHEVAAWARTVSRRPERVHTVANGVDTDRIVPSRRPVTPSDHATFTVGFVGTFKPWHGVELLVHAMSLLTRDDPSWRLLVVGAGPTAGAVHELAQALAVPLEATGALPPDRVLAQLHRMDIAAAPYPDLPGLYFSPLKLYEYLAAGMPIVASASGQIPQALDHGDLGVLVPAGDPAALAEALRALRADPARRAELRTAGRAAAVDRHTWRSVVDRTLELVDTRATA